MRKIVDVLRLHFESGHTQREIGRSLNCSPTTVGEILRRAKLAELSWPLPAGESEVGLEARLYPPAPHSHQARPEPDWPAVHTALRRKGVTLDLLWQEYQAIYPDGYRYSGFCEHYRQWNSKLAVTLRQTHAPGDKLFINYAGPTVAVIDGATGEIRQAAIFVAVLGASNYAYVEATWSQSLPDWIASNVRTLEFLQGVPRLLVPDNLKSGVTSAHRFEPDLNPTYRDLANHYGTAILPTRPRKPRDKAWVSYCTLCGRLNGNELGWCGTVAAPLALDEIDLADGFVEATVLVAVAMFAQDSSVAPLIDSGCAHPKLRRQFVGAEHAPSAQTFIAALEVVSVANDKDFLVGARPVQVTFADATANPTGKHPTFTTKSFDSSAR